MNVKTKNFQLTNKKYLSLSFANLLKDQWWVFFIPLITISLGIYFIKLWVIILSIILVLLYFGFWYLQFYAVTIMEQSKLIFTKAKYEINGNQIIIYISNKQGIPIAWDNVKKVKKLKKGLLFIISRGQIMYLPFNIFNNSNSIKFVETIAKRKNLLK